MATPKDLLAALARAYSLTETRPSDDPECVGAMREVVETQEEVGWLVVRVEADGFSAGEERSTDSHGELEEILKAFHEAGVEEIRLQTPPSPDELERLLRRLHSSETIPGSLPSARFRGLENILGLSFRRSGEDLPGMSGQIQALFEKEIPLGRPNGEVGTAAEDSAVAEGGPGAGASVGTGESNLDTAFGLPGFPEIEGYVRAYLESQGPDRTVEENRLRNLGQDLTRSRNIPSLGRLVELLLEPSFPEGADVDTLELARDLTTPAVASHFVARLGSTRDEGGRRELVRIISQLGREGALALTDALRESRDRFQRRTFMDAMVAFGPLGLEMAEDMVEDPRWFVVRNGVALLGELGGENAVSHLQATLTNQDSRVRREAALSLAKVGGEEAETLLLGMLEDGDPDVRAKTCRALGTLRSHRATTRLLALLRDKSKDVQAECLQALGQIGDPETVRAIEKRAFRGLFSRPSREVRIAAFRALAGIDTHPALKALERGAKDSDKSVRTVVKALMG